jgi:putative addiction module component (TIGR02574 family)
MSKADILAELPKLTAEDRDDILAQLWSLEEQEALRRGPSAQEQALLDAELADYAANPNAGSPWADVQARLRQRA